MRWWYVPVVLALAWFVFTLTPLVSLYSLARAVEARDVAYIDRHVNFRTLRLSLVRQTASAARAAISESGDLDPRDQQKLNEAAVGLALALAETMVTAKTVVDLLDDGWPGSLDVAKAPGAGAASGLRIEGLERLAAYYLATEMRGFRTVVVAVPPEAPRARQFRIRLRLRAWSWRLVDIEVTEDLRAQMAQKLARTLARMRAGEKAKDPVAQPEDRAPASPPP
ncbi:hypothetical protein J2X36_001638 [Methylobacterium sp. BE186]|uniref:DUF2939 domain-containing protein n=1 Tax=Methylobacterium sp. BE186 TaxID=2817715 RepID=UPI0028605C5A|nr:DUF2939 domain-containing protein [Methylobacterium sp. BE186]MDR7036896.1 hypothetical protein [Methylobacterium sp. BE186]